MGKGKSGGGGSKGGLKFGLGGFLPRKVRERNKALKEAEEFQKGIGAKGSVGKGKK